MLFFIFCYKCKIKFYNYFEKHFNFVIKINKLQFHSKVFCNVCLIFGNIYIIIFPDTNLKLNKYFKYLYFIFFLFVAEI